MTAEVTQEATSTCKAAVTNVVNDNATEIGENPAAALILNINTSVLCNYMVASVFYNPDLLAGACSPSARRVIRL